MTKINGNGGDGEKFIGMGTIHITMSLCSMTML